MTNVLAVEPTPAMNIPAENIVNRPLAEVILDVLRAKGPAWPYGDGSFDVKHLPTTGEVIDAIGRQRTPANFASVSRSLSRLGKRGLVVAYTTTICTVGNGSRWAIAPNQSERTDLALAVENTELHGSGVRESEPLTRSGLGRPDAVETMGGDL